MNDALMRLLPPRLTNALGRARARLTYRYDPLATQAYSQEGEDLVLRRLFNDARSGFYVDVGAHHPKRFSNTYLLYRAGWRGINIEPNPAVAAAFRRARARDVNLTVGVSDVPGELMYHQFDEPALNTFDEGTATSIANGGRYRIVARTPVRVRRLDELLDEHLPAGTRIDVLTIDVEGHDLPVLRSNDWTRFTPRCVLVEANGASLARIADAPVHDFLTAAGYDIFAKTVNTLFYLKGSGDATDDAE